jgi:hypothetical protein
VQGIESVGGFEHRPAIGFEKAAADPADRILVIGQDDHAPMILPGRQWWRVRRGLTHRLTRAKENQLGGPEYPEDR